MNNLQALKEHTGEYLQSIGVDIQAASTRNTACPVCGRGHRTGCFHYYADSERVKCFSCGFKGDLFDLMARIRGISAREAISEAAALYGDGGGTSSGRKTPADDGKVLAIKKSASLDQSPEPDYSAKYREWHAALMKDPEALAFLQDHYGITPEAAERWNLGLYFDHGRRICIPRTKSAYSGRAVDGSSPKYKATGPKRIPFNYQVLLDDDDATAWMPYVIVEGEIDAIAVAEMGYPQVIAAAGAANTNIIAYLQATRPDAAYILAFDNDQDASKGPQKQAEFAQKMRAAGLCCIEADPWHLYEGDRPRLARGGNPNEPKNKDAGDILQAAVACARDCPYPEDYYMPFLGRLEEYASKAMGELEARNEEAEARRCEAEEERERCSGVGAVEDFLRTIQTRRYEPISTGLKSLDRAIGGGLYRQTVAILGAAPGLGKTTLAAQIAENMAQRGEDVLYLNMEMSREQLMARSLSRIICRAGGDRMTPTQILQGYAWEDWQRDAVQDAAQQYAQGIAGHLTYNPGADTTDLDAILAKIQTEQERIGHAPILFLDYLQLLTGAVQGRAEDPVDTIRRAMQRIKRYAIDNNTVAVIITATNRASMANGDAGLFSGRDTSNIEYGADLHLGLEYTAITNDDKKLKEIEKMISRYYAATRTSKDVENYKMYCEDYTLRINKNRFAACGQVPLHFNGAASTYYEVDQSAAANASANMIRKSF